MARRGPDARTGEERLIARYFKPLATHPGALGLVDDAALLDLRKGEALVLTVDGIVGGVHFFPDDPPDAVAKKALRVNLSDLAAKGAMPAGFLLMLALPEGYGERWLKAFTRGLAADAKAYRCPLLGGDTVMTPGPLTISIAAFGTLPRRSMVCRDGARTGDRVIVTGTIGDAALGLALRNGQGTRWRLSAARRRHLASRFLLPRPRNALTEALRRHASAAMDVSDGLAGDLGKLLRASGKGADIEVARVPLSAAARAVLAADPGRIETVLTGGDDFEVVATVPQRELAAFLMKARRARIRVAVIGRVSAERGARFHAPDGRVLRFRRASFSHF